MGISNQANPVFIDSHDGVPSAAEDLREADVPAESRAGAIIVNADDWGRDISTTDRTHDCLLQGAISSVSAMVFMEDSERAADIARQYRVSTGLHLNFTLPFTSRPRHQRLMEYQEQIGGFLSSHRLAPIIYHRRLVKLFDYVVKAQIEEYERIYGTPIERVDGHHHMHLSRNVMVQKLLPEGTIVRRNLSFGQGEKSYLNRLYRRRQDLALARRHRTTDFFFDLHPVQPAERLKRICSLAGQFNIEIETHPIREVEFRFLVNGDLARCAGNVAVARSYMLRDHEPSRGAESLTAAQQDWRHPR